MPAKWNPELEFEPSRELSIGVELELQLLNPHDLRPRARRGRPAARGSTKRKLPGAVKPEITESMIEVNTLGARRFAGAAAQSCETCATRSCRRPRRAQRARSPAAARTRSTTGTTGASIPTERFQHVLERYGYLAKQFTVFGQHIHVGCPSGDDAVYLVAPPARYIPHFIALSASSPFSAGRGHVFPVFAPAPR